MPTPSLILASSSPKRKEILTSLGLRFKTCNPRTRECTTAFSARELVKKNALLKAKSVTQFYPQNFILGVDTIVSSGKKIFLKPKSWQEGLCMLQSYRKQTNYVYTGLAIYEPKGKSFLVQTQKSRFRLTSMNEKRQKDIYRLIYSSKQSGGFSIEGLGSILLDEISGSYYNILGLPVYLLDKMLLNIGVDLLSFRKKI